MQLEIYLGLEDFEIEYMIESANSVFWQRTTPGCWPEKGEIRLIPGVDFALPEQYIEYW